MESLKQSVVELLQEVKYSASSDQDPIRDKRITMAILVSQRLATLYRLLKEWFVAIRQQIHSRRSNRLAIYPLKKHLSCFSVWWCRYYPYYHLPVVRFKYSNSREYSQYRKRCWAYPAPYQWGNRKMRRILSDKCYTTVSTASNDERTDNIFIPGSRLQKTWFLLSTQTLLKETFTFCKFRILL